MALAQTSMRYVLRCFEAESQAQVSHWDLTEELSDMSISGKLRKLTVNAKTDLDGDERERGRALCL